MFHWVQCDVHFIVFLIDWFSFLTKMQAGGGKKKTHTLISFPILPLLFTFSPGNRDALKMAAIWKPSLSAFGFMWQCRDGSLRSIILDPPNIHLDVTHARALKKYSTEKCDYNFDGIVYNSCIYLWQAGWHNSFLTFSASRNKCALHKCKNGPALTQRCSLLCTETVHVSDSPFKKNKSATEL